MGEIEGSRSRSAQSGFFLLLLPPPLFCAPACEPHRLQSFRETCSSVVLHGLHFLQEYPFVLEWFPTGCCVSVCHGSVPSTAQGTSALVLSHPWAAGNIYTPMEPLQLHLAAPLLLLSLLFPSLPTWHFLPFLKCFHRGTINFTGGLSLGHGAD